MQARRQRNEGLIAWGTALVAVAFAQILLGALVAGIDAGRSFPEWPLMAGEVFPPSAFELEPVWRNFTENAGLVQFNHRLLGYALLVLGARRLAAQPRERARRTSAAPSTRWWRCSSLQVVLGVVTVLYGAPWQVAIVHQLGAVALFVLILRARFAALYPRSQRIARG